jgi:hypothetical protein
MSDVEGKPTISDMLAVQMATLAQLIAHLDYRGVADAEAFLVELHQVRTGMPPGRAAALDMFCSTLNKMVGTARARKGPPMSGTH